MNIENMDDAIVAAERFLKLAKKAKQAHADEQKQQREYLARMKAGNYSLQNSPNPQAAVHRAAAKRASMDLTRALARYRR